MFLCPQHGKFDRLSKIFFNPLLMFVFLMTEFDIVLLDFTTQAVRIQITLKMAVFRKTDVKHLEWGFN